MNLDVPMAKKAFPHIVTFVSLLNFWLTNFFID